VPTHLQHHELVPDVYDTLKTEHWADRIAPTPVWYPFCCWRQFKALISTYNIYDKLCTDGMTGTVRVVAATPPVSLSLHCHCTITVLHPPFLPGCAFICLCCKGTSYVTKGSHMLTSVVKALM